MYNETKLMNHTPYTRSIRTVQQYSDYDVYLKLKETVKKWDNNKEMCAENLYTSVINNDFNGVRKACEQHVWCDVNFVPENRHATVCWIAAYKQYNKILEYLLQQKANPNIPDVQSKQMPLYHAIANNNAETVELLVKFGARISDDDKRRAKRDEQDDIIKLLG